MKGREIQSSQVSQRNYHFLSIIVLMEELLLSD